MPRRHPGYSGAFAGIITAGKQLHAWFRSQGFADVFEVFESSAEDYY